MPNSGASKARLVITAIILEKRTVTEVVADYGVSRSWVYELLARYRAEGEDAFEPRSRRPLTSPQATPAREFRTACAGGYSTRSRPRASTAEPDLGSRS